MKTVGIIYDDGVDINYTEIDADMTHTHNFNRATIVTLAEDTSEHAVCCQWTKHFQRKLREILDRSTFTTHPN